MTEPTRPAFRAYGDFFCDFRPGARLLAVKDLSKLVIALALSASSTPAFADDVDVSAFEWIDVIETKDGSVVKGVVFEQEPGVKYKLATSDGSVHVIQAEDVVKLTKARNKFYRGGAQGGYATSGGGNSVGAHYNGGASSLPAPMAKTGMRASFDLAAVFPGGDVDTYETSLTPTFRIGYEHLFGNFGLTGGGMVRFTYWALPGDSGDANWTLETHGFARAALHLGRVAPYVGGTLGIDTNYVYVDRAQMSATTLGVGLNLDFGLSIAATPQLAFDIGGDYHPGTDTIYDNPDPLDPDKAIEYFALRAGAQLRW